MKSDGFGDKPLANNESTPALSRFSPDSENIQADQSRKSTSRTSDAAFINITITRANGEPAANAEIFIISNEKIQKACDWIEPPVERPRADARAGPDGMLKLKSSGSGEDVNIVIYDPVCQYSYYENIRDGAKIQLSEPANAVLQVLDFNKKPIRAAKLTLRRTQYSVDIQGGTRYYDSSARTLAMSVVEQYITDTDDNGEARFSGPSLGTYRGELDAGLAGNIEFIIDLGTSRPLLIELEPLSTLRGIVKDRETGAPVANARVFVASSGSSIAPLSKSEFTNSSGQYELRVPWRGAPGVVAVAMAPGYAMDVADLQEMNPTSPLYKELILTKGISVRGSVTDTQGKPIANASVRAFAGPHGYVVGQAVTAADGTYQFPALGDFDQYEFAAFAPRYSYEYVKSTKAQLPPKPIALERGGVIAVDIPRIPPTVRAGDAALITLYKQSGSTLIRSARHAIPLKSAATAAGNDAAASRPSVNIQKTGADASTSPLFETEGPGTFQLFAEIPGHAPARFVNITIGPGEEKHVALEISQGVRVSGMVYGGKERRPLADAQVALLGPPPGSRTHGEATENVIKTGADGKFTISNVPAGESELLIFNGVLASRYVALKIPEGATEHAIPPVTLPQTSTLRGKVQFNDTMAPGLLVAIDSTYGWGMAVDPDIDGSFWYGGLVPETYTLYLTTPDLPGAHLNITRVRVPEGEDVNIEIPAGNATLRGVVRGGGYEKYDTFSVTLRNGNAEVACTNGVSAGGMFQFGLLAPGEYPLVLMAGDGGAGTFVTKQVTLKPGPNELVIDLSGIHHDLIIKDTKGAVLEGVDVRLRPVDSVLRRSVYASSTGEGGIAKLRNLEPGEYKVVLEKDHYEIVARHTLRIERSGPRRTELVLPRESLVTVKITDTAGRACEGAEASARRVDSPYSGDSYNSANAAGVATIPWCGAGEHTLTARAPGFFPVRRKLVVEAEKPLETALALERASTLKVTVQNAAGAPVAGVGVAVQSAAQGSSAEWISAGFCNTTPAGGATGADGSLQFATVPAGALVVSAAGASATVHAEGGKPAEVTLVIQ